MKELYERPIIDVYLLQTADILTMSEEEEQPGGGDPSQPDLDW